jgi:predicted PhzF superfamily epimerase YddE/YHI9/ribosomal protein S18 acetylase RimI-like enzyme
MTTPEPNPTSSAGSILPPVRQRSSSSVFGGNPIGGNVSGNLSFRNVTPMDLPDVYKLERASYPPDEAASRAKLQYRQHHAAPYFRCAILTAPDDSQRTDLIDAAESANGIQHCNVGVPSSHAQEDTHPATDASHTSQSGTVLSPMMIGYITATRCHAFSKDSMSIHSSTGPLLAIHSIVVAEPFRRQGYATAMIDNYIKTVQNMDLKYGIQKIVLIAKANLLSFYVKNGFKVTKPSDIVHGGEPWYECELELGLGGGDVDRGCQYWVVDSFAKLPNGNVSSWRGSGNPAAVVMVNPSQITTVTPTTTGTLPLLSSTMPSSSNTNDENNDNDLFSPNPTFDPDKEENIQWMKAVSKEFNLSETAFIWEYHPMTTVLSNGEASEYPKSISPSGDGSNTYEIRFYTRNGSPVDLCGHATLAASSVVFQFMATYGKKRDEMIISFRTKNGTILKARPSNSSTSISSPSILKGISFGTKVSMEFPWKGLKDWDSLDEKSAAIQMIGDAFFPNTDASVLEQDHIIFIGLEDNKDDLLVELKYESFISLPPNGQDMNIESLTIWDGYKRGVILCCRAPLPSDEDSNPISGAGGATSTFSAPNIAIDFLSRFFAPKIGIVEDSVTGSAHCLMGPYYGALLDKRSVTGFQMSERGGIVECLLKRSGEEEFTVKRSVVLSGIATTTMSGTLYL